MAYGYQVQGFRVLCLPLLGRVRVSGFLGLGFYTLPCWAEKDLIYEFVPKALKGEACRFPARRTR